jgi:hypothetical protein
MASEESMARAFTNEVPSKWDVGREPVHGSPNYKYYAESPNGRWRLEAHGEPTEGWMVQLRQPGEEYEHDSVLTYSPEDMEDAVRSLFERNIGQHRSTRDPGMFDQLF